MRLIWKDAQLSNIPVIIYSATINIAVVEATFENDAVFFFRKFTSYDTMLKLFDELIKGKTASEKPADKQQFMLSYFTGCQQ